MTETLLVGSRVLDSESDGPRLFVVHGCTRDPRRTSLTSSGFNTQSRTTLDGIPTQSSMVDGGSELTVTGLRSPPSYDSVTTLPTVVRRSSRNRYLQSIVEYGQVY